MSGSSVLKHPVDEATYLASCALYVIVLHETVIEVGVELLCGKEAAFQRLISDLPDYPVSGGLEVTMTAMRPISLTGRRHHGVGSSAPHLLRALQFIASLEFAVGRFQEVLCCLYVFGCLHSLTNRPL